jgi:oligopeptide transport system permease protein
MLGYALRRFVGGVLTLFLIITFTFVMMRLAPGGPFARERPIPPEILRNIEAHYDLDQPLWEQYRRYLAGLARGDLGPSYRRKDFTVAELIAQGAPASFLVGGLALVVATTLGVTAGIVAAARQNSGVDYAVMGVAMIGIAIPNFVLAPLLTLVLGVFLRWLPVGGWGGGQWTYLLLPVLGLALPQVARIARLTRGSMIEVLNANFIRTARAKGLGERRVVLRHALKSALLPVLSYLGPAAAALLTGSVVIEQIFAIPGIGRYFVEAALDRDYPVVMGVVIVFGALIIVLNLVVDLLYGLLDPRVRAG